jgi:hypothetical protein
VVLGDVGIERASPAGAARIRSQNSSTPFKVMPLGFGDVG